MNDDQKYWYCARLAYLIIKDFMSDRTAAETWKMVYSVMCAHGSSGNLNQFVSKLEAHAEASNIPLPLV